MADKKITSEVFVSYFQCSRKAFLLLYAEDQGTPHDYPCILKERRKKHKFQYLEAFKQTNEDAQPFNEKRFNRDNFLIEATLRTDCWEANCDILTKVDQDSSNQKSMYEPTIIVGTYGITKEQKIELTFIGKILGKIQKQFPVAGKIVGMDGKVHRVKLDNGYRAISPLLKTLKAWMEEKPLEPPALILNKHCSSCQFEGLCREQAVKEDNLSLLDRMTPKVIQKYNQRGIFTVHQLSYLFKSRRNRRRKTKALAKHNLELQALAIRDQKIYVQELPDLVRRPIQIFLDIESIPDQDFYYLMGILVCTEEIDSFYSFWADTPEDEEQAWKKLIERLNEHPESTIYHYGNYELRAINKIENRYSIDCEHIKERLVNVNSYVFGHLYFPVFSNGLKSISTFLGFSWLSLKSSGLQSIAWRYEWEAMRRLSLKEKLIDYNSDDCSALKMLFESIEKISKGFSSLEIGAGIGIIPANEIKDDSTFKFGSSQYMYQELDFINKYSYFDYQREKIFFRNKDNKKKAAKKTGKKAVQYRINKKIELPIPSSCSRCNGSELSRHGRKYKTVLDIKFFDFGVRSWVIKYSTSRVRCRSCGKAFTVNDFHDLNGKYGHNLKIWIVYQMIALRQTYNLIQKNLHEVFGYQFSTQICHNSKYEIADFYASTYQDILEKLKNGSLIHADETTVSIQGKDSYIWVLTSLEEVAYIYYPTREGNAIKDILQDFSGVLVSDFYSVYDSFECSQQKCLVHLIRDMNDDLRSNPFDEQYKNFVKSFGKLLKSIVLTIDEHGLKREFLEKYESQSRDFIDTFLASNSGSEIVSKYQKKFTKYQNKLFEFLRHDDVPWNNNNAENAIKGFASYRKITNGCFSENGIKNYLILLSLCKTCQYKQINFLAFLRSKETFIDKF